MVERQSHLNKGVARIPILQVLLGACSFGILSTLVKLAQHDGFFTYDLSGSQFMFGALFSWILVWCRRMLSNNRRRMQTASIKQAASLMAIGTLTGLTGLLYYRALEDLSVSMAVMLKFQFAWQGVLLYALVTRKLPGKKQMSAVVLLIIGTVLSTGMMDQHSWSTWTAAGILFGFGSALTFTLFLFFNHRTAAGVDPYLRSSYMVTGAAIILMFIHPPTFIVNGMMAAGLWKWGIMLAIFGGLLSPLLFAIGIPKLNSGLASILCAVELPFALIASGVILSESLCPLQWIGVAMILLGIAIPQMFDSSKNLKNRRWTNG